jgi:hypothetical protein
VINLIEADPEYQGSYNYRETTVVGSVFHTKFDVAPHVKDPNGYVKVADRFSDLFSRQFPPLNDEDLKW